MSELRNLVNSSVQDLYDEQGNLKRIHELPPEVAKTISSLEMGDKGGIKKLIIHSKLIAIEIGARILQMVRAGRETVVPVQIIIGSGPDLPPAPEERPRKLPEWGE